MGSRGLRSKIFQIEPLNRNPLRNSKEIQTEIAKLATLTLEIEFTFCSVPAGFERINLRKRAPLSSAWPFETFESALKALFKAKNCPPASSSGWQRNWSSNWPLSKWTLSNWALSRTSPSTFACELCLRIAHSSFAFFLEQRSRNDNETFSLSNLIQTTKEKRSRLIFLKHSNASHRIAKPFGPLSSHFWWVWPKDLQIERLSDWSSPGQLERSRRAAPYSRFLCEEAAIIQCPAVCMNLEKAATGKRFKKLQNASQRLSLQLAANWTDSLILLARNSSTLLELLS